MVKDKSSIGKLCLQKEFCNNQNVKQILNPRFAAYHTCSVRSHLDSVSPPLISIVPIILFD